MTESFIHYLWKFRLFYPDLKTTTGESLVILSPGAHNTNAGPDFLDARLKIGETTWAGNVEVHVRASDWFRHRHDQDPVYANIILHVVDEEDQPVYDVNGHPVATFSIKGNYNSLIREKYTDFITGRTRIPCENLIREMDPFVFTSWAPALSIERFASRTARFMETWKHCGHDWEECFYRQLVRAFGFRINADAFELVSEYLPLRIIRKHHHSVLQMEALFYGLAGMITGDEDYPRSLAGEFDHLAQKYHLDPLQPGLIKFLRLRPSNFPTIRLSQLCHLLHKQADLFSLILEAEQPADLYTVFNVQTSEYWETHFIFGKSSPGSPKNLGESSIRLLVLNLVIPFLYFYGSMKNQDRFREKAITFLELEQGESNEIITFWKSLGMPAGNALFTQALLQLMQNYCNCKRCLECRIGLKLLQ